MPDDLSLRAALAAEQRLWRVRHLLGYAIRATDGDLGEVSDILFDDSDWRVRHLVADTGRWFGRQVLIPVAELGHPSGDDRAFSVSLTRDQVKHSPDIDTDEPVSRQQESALYAHYGWTPWWGLPVIGSDGVAYEPSAMEGVPLAAETGAPLQRGDPHLRSARELIGYAAEGRDGTVGEVEDLLLQESGWRIRYVVADAAAWLPDRKLLMSTVWISGIDWAERRIHTDLPRDQVRNSPIYEPSRPLDAGYEAALHGWYGLPFSS
jgi:uncharacterized protein YrrD